MVLLKEQFEAAKKKQGFHNKPRNKKRFKEVETGFLKTRKVRCQACNQGFMWRYRWFDVEEDKYKVMTSIDFLKLKKKVRDRGLDWRVEDYYLARKTAKKIGLPLRDLQ